MITSDQPPALPVGSGVDAIRGRQAGVGHCDTIAIDDCEPNAPVAAPGPGARNDTTVGRLDKDIIRRIVVTYPFVLEPG